MDGTSPEPASTATTPTGYGAKSIARGIGKTSASRLINSHLFGGAKRGKKVVSCRRGR